VGIRTGQALAEAVGVFTTAPGVDAHTIATVTTTAIDIIGTIILEPGALVTRFDIRAIALAAGALERVRAIETQARIAIRPGGAKPPTADPALGAVLARIGWLTSELGIALDTAFVPLAFPVIAALLFRIDAGTDFLLAIPPGTALESGLTIGVLADPRGAAAGHNAGAALLRAVVCGATSRVRTTHPARASDARTALLI
jgi:hypothetical protein